MKKLTGNLLKMTLTLSLSIVLGIVVSRLVIDYWPTVKQQILTEESIYMTSNEPLKLAYTNAKIMPLDWAALLPQTEKQIIAKYQAPLSKAQNLEMVSAQVFRSIQASSDQNYQQALNSTNTVEQLKNQMVSISGFIVPIDFYADKSVQNLFLVPYFGACLHFPPPPPNQIIFVQLESGFSQLDITQAYTLEGRISLDLFEDPMGTSAYILKPVVITKFYGQPDDFRRH